MRTVEILKGTGPTTLTKQWLEDGTVVEPSAVTFDEIKTVRNEIKDVQKNLRDAHLKREEFRVLFLTGRNEIIAQRVLFEGSLAESVVSPREIILTSVQLAAASVILTHNHPSGDPGPSKEDRLITQKISIACRYCDIIVLDHIIIGADSYYSFADHGLMDSPGK